MKAKVKILLSPLSASSICQAQFHSCCSVLNKVHRWQSLNLAVLRQLLLMCCLLIYLLLIQDCKDIIWQNSKKKWKISHSLPFPSHLTTLPLTSAFVRLSWMNWKIFTLELVMHLLKFLYFRLDLELKVWSKVPGDGYGYQMQCYFSSCTPISFEFYFSQRKVTN